MQKRRNNLELESMAHLKRKVTVSMAAGPVGIKKRRNNELTGGYS
jgi:hypothetical protein